MAQTVKVFVYNAGDPGSISGLGRSPGEEMAIHSSTIAWKIISLQSKGLSRVFSNCNRILIIHVILGSLSHLKYVETLGYATVRSQPWPLTVYITFSLCLWVGSQLYGFP